MNQMGLNRNPMSVFQEEAPEVAAAFSGLIEAVSQTKGLDTKTRQLMYIAMKASQGDTSAVAAHTPMAIKAGATREELKDTILLTLTISGIKGVVTCLPTVLDIFDNQR